MPNMHADQRHNVFRCRSGPSELCQTILLTKLLGNYRSVPDASQCCQVQLKNLEVHVLRHAINVQSSYTKHNLERNSAIPTLRQALGNHNSEEALQFITGIRHPQGPNIAVHNSKLCSHSCSCDPGPSRTCAPLTVHRAWCGSVAGLVPCQNA